jgi:hypothetical protein
MAAVDPRLARACPRCGAQPGRPCVMVADALTTDKDGDRVPGAKDRGDEREVPHLVRGGAR